MLLIQALKKRTSIWKGKGGGMFEIVVELSNVSKKTVSQGEESIRHSKCNRNLLEKKVSFEGHKAALWQGHLLLM